jgi:hypothetical protein
MEFLRDNERDFRSHRMWFRGRLRKGRRRTNKFIPMYQPKLNRIGTMFKMWFENE